jgi:arabinogalactan endo-1,4-beta-galactosidase
MAKLARVPTAKEEAVKYPSPKALVVMHAENAERQHRHVTTFQTITKNERKYHEELAELWRKIVVFVKEQS